MPKKSESKEPKTKKTAAKKAAKKESKKLTQAEFEKKVLELSKEGLTSDKIGERLRQGGIHPKDYDKKISRVIKEKGEYKNPSLENVEKKLKNLEDHYAKNRQDKNALKQREKISARVRKLRNYFARK
jgi:ribosomal protein S15P/S13E